MAVTYVRVDGTSPVVGFLVDRLSELLSTGNRVLWLVPGGSAIAIVVAVSQRLKDLPLDHLTVSLTDERFGPVGHHDSNWQQLRAAGFMLEGATLVSVLHDASMPEEVAAFNMWLDSQLNGAGYTLGFFGMGPDGHTAGILPGSPAVEATGLAVGYDGGAFQRITMTGKAIAMLDEAVLYAVGAEKHAMLDRLSDSVTPDVQPAQYLKLVNKLTVFNDRKGDQQ